MKIQWWKGRTLLETYIMFMYHTWLLIRTKGLGKIKYAYFGISLMQIISRALGYRGTIDMTYGWFYSKQTSNMGLAYSFYLPQIFLIAFYQNYYFTVPCFSDSTFSKIFIDYIFINFCLYMITIAVVGFSQSIYQSKRIYAVLLLILWISLYFGLWNHHYSYYLCCLIFVFAVFVFSKFFPNCFSFGEYSILCQTLALIMTLLWQKYYTHVFPLYRKEAAFGPNVLLSSLLSCLLCIFVYVIIFIAKRSLKLNYILCEFLGISISFSGFLINLKYALSFSSLREFIIWLIDYTLHNGRLLILTWWSILSILTLIFVRYTSFKQNASYSQVISGRKIFHLAISLVYIPGMIYQEDLLTICSAGVLWLFILSECIRLTNFTKLGTKINSSYLFFLKKGEEYRFIVPNHFLLLITVSIPLWIIKFIHFGTYSIETFAHRLSFLLCGVISVGIGDTAASFVGIRYGNHKIANGKKSYEGCFASFICQFISYILVYNFTTKSFYPSMAYLRYFVVSLTTSLIEGITVQEDNIILSFISMSHLIYNLPVISSV